jgi:SAM-dependent methyltransferase
MTNFYATLARYYDSEHADKDEDIPLYQDLADHYGDPILVIGAGTGRLALQLAETYSDVHGIEIEAAMLDRARAKRNQRLHLENRVFFHLGDALDYKLDEKFNLVIIPYNTFMHFHTQGEQLRLLQRCREWLTDDGALVIDLPNAGDAFASQDNEGIMLERTFIDQDSGHIVMQQSSSRLDRASQLMDVTWLYDEIDADGGVKRTLIEVTLYYYFLNELRLLLGLAGLTIDNVYGDFDMSEYADGSYRMIIVAERSH